MTAKLLVLGMACLLLGSGPRQPAATLTPPPSIDGFWKVEKVFNQGNQIVPPKWEMYVTFTANKVTFGEWQHEYCLDQSVVPCAFDLKAGSEVLRGICQFKGDKLMICGPDLTSQPRPAAFTPQAGILIILKRVKQLPPEPPLDIIFKGK